MATYPHIYVSSEYGTNSGGTDTSQETQVTGNINTLNASDVYEDIGAAITGASPGDGDTIYVADNHNASYDNGGSVSLNPSATPGGAGIRIISCDNTDMDVYKPGASDILNDGADEFVLTYNGLIAGMTMGSEDDNFLTQSTCCHWVFIDHTFPAGAQTGDTMFGAMLGDGTWIEMYNCTFDWPNATTMSDCIKDLANSAKWHMYGGSITASGGGAINELISANGMDVGGGCEIYFEGVDLSGITGNLGTIRYADASDSMKWHFNNCIINSSVTIPTSFASSNGNPHVSFLLTGTDDSSNTLGGNYRYHKCMWDGYARNKEDVYVSADTAWYESSDISSIEVVTGAECDHEKPLIFDLTSYIDLNEAASDVVYVNLTSSVTLTDADVFAYLVYPDSAHATTLDYHTISSSGISAGNLWPDLVGGGTTLTNPGGLGASDWVGEKTNFYSLALDTSGDAGEQFFAKVVIVITKASIAADSVYFSTSLTAG